MKRKSAAMQIRSFDYDIKAVSDDGLFSGYGSVFGVVDSYNEVVAPGAFVESLADTRAKGRTLPVLWHHRGSEPIGDWDINQLKEDAHGLFGVGQLWLQDAPYPLAQLARRFHHFDPNPELVRIRSRDFRLIEVSTLAAGQVLARVFSRCLPLQRGVGTNLVIVRPPGVDFLLGVGK